jgi:LuxR family maltose regulon positive regulatory protein
VDCVSPDLLEAITWRRDGARLLAGLHRDGVLAVHVGGGQHWYRYHPLLRAHLYRQARELMPIRLRDLHRAAADWYAANALPGDALHHALCAGAWTFATDLLDRHWPELLSRRSRRVLRLVMPAPPPEAATDVGLALAFAVQRRACGDDAGMRTFLRLAEQSAQAGIGSRLGAVLDGVRLASALLDGNTDRVRVAAERLTTVPVGVVLDDAVRALALAVTADACLTVADIDGMEGAARDGLAFARRAGLRTGQLTALVRQSIVDLARGRLSAAVHNAELAFEGALDAGQPSSTETGIARLVLAQVQLERGSAAEARYHIDQAFAGSGTADAQLAWGASVLLARWHRLRGERTAAIDLVRTVRADPILLAPPLAVWFHTLLEADLCVADGQHLVAARLLGGLPAEQRRLGATAVIAARVALAQGHPDAVAPLLEHSVGLTDSLLVAVEAALVRARARWDLGDRAGACRFMEEALGLAAEEGIRWPFLVEMPTLHDLLIAQLGRDTAHADTIVGLTTDPVLSAMGEPAIGALQEPLTRREHAVLRHLNTMLSISEIALVLNVSANTVKTHMKGVYRKLDVGRRRDAVQRARDLGLN